MQGDAPAAFPAGKVLDPRKEFLREPFAPEFLVKADVVDVQVLAGHKVAVFLFDLKPAEGIAQHKPSVIYGNEYRLAVVSHKRFKLTCGVFGPVMPEKVGASIRMDVVYLAKQFK